jgi:single-strand DNA-binding protein
MKASGIARIGKDVEVRYSPSGDAIANISLAFSYGKKQSDGKRATQWVDATLFGKRAESLAPYLKKGNRWER